MLWSYWFADVFFQSSANLWLLASSTIRFQSHLSPATLLFLLNIQVSLQLLHPSPSWALPHDILHNKICLGNLSCHVLTVQHIFYFLRVLRTGPLICISVFHSKMCTTLALFAECPCLSSICHHRPNKGCYKCSISCPGEKLWLSVLSLLSF